MIDGTAPMTALFMEVLMAELRDDQWQAIDAEIVAGRMISAIKSFREMTAAGLKEAKDAVEARQQVLAGLTLERDAGGDESSERAWEPVDAEIFAGRKIRAIKLYRSLSGVGLKEAKDAIEARENELRQSMPANFAPVGKAGCLGVILIVVAVLIMFGMA
jgi:ribosomal protein L7/L12